MMAYARTALPAGTVTLMFVDIEGSTVLLQDLGDAYAFVIARYRVILRAAVAEFGGVEVGTAGDGFFAAFEHAADALEAALAATAGFAAEPWSGGSTLKARIGLHTGAVRIVEQSYMGLDVHRAARISAAGHGGQILLSKETVAAIEPERVAGRVTLRDLGAHRLKDLRYPEMLFDAVLADTDPSFPPLRTVDSRLNNLPQTAGPLIGRDSELDEIVGLLGREPTRLLTLTGPGGTGKTRLALACAAALVDRFPAGVLQVPLAGIAEPALVIPAIAQTLGVREHGEGSLIDAVCGRLKRAEMLLLLDNFEHLMTAASDAVDLLERCPELKLLVTSRETLGVRFERVYPIEPLSVPIGRRANAFIAIGESPAVRLFVERVRDHDPGFQLDTQNAPVIGEICRRLDGLPLAIELAASRLSLLSPEMLLDRLSRRLDILKGGRDKSERHRTLRAAIDWSYQLLQPEEQRLLEAVAVFAGGFSLESAEAVGGELEWLDIDVLDGVSSLAGKSLLARAMVSGERRLRMLDTVRDFALEKLAAHGRAASVQECCAGHFLDLAETVAPCLLNADQRTQVNRLLDEQDNLRAALAWSLQQPDAMHLSRGIKALLWFWISRGLFTEGHAWVTRALAHAERCGAPAERALIVDAAGWLRILAGDYGGALAHCRLAHALFSEHGAPDDIARSKVTLGITLAVSGDEANGPPMIVEGLEMFRAMHDDMGTALALIALGEGLRAGGDSATAEDLYHEALEKLGTLGNVYWPGQVLQNLAHMRLAVGDWRAANDFLAQALELGQTYDYPMITNLCLAGFGGVAVARDEPALAARVLGLTERRLEELAAHFEPLDRAAFEGYAQAAAAALGAEAYAREVAEGRKWTLEEAVEAARSLRA